MSSELLTGITLIRHGNRLGYPYIQCINSLTSLCDKVIVNVDPVFDDYDGTVASVDALRRTSPHLIWFASSWDMKNTGDGSELAKQANKALQAVDTEWVVYLQADEIIHEKDHESLRAWLPSLPAEITQIELYRTYFWKNLQTRAPQYEIFLGRIFRAGTHEVGGDGMYLIRKSGSVIRSPYWIYHYSRIGPEERVTARVRTLDQLFLDEPAIKELPPFKYSELSSDKLVTYTETHPRGIAEFYAV